MLPWKGTWYLGYLKSPVSFTFPYLEPQYTWYLRPSISNQVAMIKTTIFNIVFLYFTTEVKTYFRLHISHKSSQEMFSEKHQKGMFNAMVLVASRNNVFTFLSDAFTPSCLTKQLVYQEISKEDMASIKVCIKLLCHIQRQLE